MAQSPREQPYIEDGGIMDNQDFWVFGYGSLMWKPGFNYIESIRGRLNGLHRAPCIYSWEHRGTQENPGIVLGLDKGGSCIGLAFRIAGENRDKTMAYLRARELVTNVYFEAERNVQLVNGTIVKCVCYIVDRRHKQYAGQLSVDALVEQISGAEGKSGPNEAYFFDTAEKLRIMGIQDTKMEKIVKGLNNCA